MHWNPWAMPAHLESGLPEVAAGLVRIQEVQPFDLRFRLLKRANHFLDRDGMLLVVHEQVQSDNRINLDFTKAIFAHPYLLA